MERKVLHGEKSARESMLYVPRAVASYVLGGWKRQLTPTFVVFLVCP